MLICERYHLFNFSYNDECFNLILQAIDQKKIDMSKFSSVVSKHKSNQKLTDQYYHAMIASYDSLRCRGKLDCISVIMYHQYLITMEQLKTIVEDLLDYGPNNQYHIDVELYNSYMNFLKVQDAYSDEEKSEIDELREMLLILCQFYM